MNKWLFNKDTIDKAPENLMLLGQKVAGGDRLGKTIIFAKNDAHARFIAERFDRHYPHYAGHFARVVTYSTDYAQSVIDDFSKPQAAPHIAVSVDMLDTGIDVPEVLNLVFFKPVFSKTKFWQMVGRGTRLAPGLFGPGRGPGFDKEFFYIFDFCCNLEYFKENPESTEGALGTSLSKQLFTVRVELIEELDNLTPPVHYTELRSAVAEHLRTDVAAMNLDNFIVRPQRRLVEHYAKPEFWQILNLEQRSELVEKIAGLPSENVDPDVEAKQFDVLMLSLQLAVLRADAGFTKLRKKVEAIASLLSEKANIPMVRAQLLLIEELQTDEYWQDITPTILENARKSLRSLVKFIDKRARKPVYTDFEDTLGLIESVDLPAFGVGVGFIKFKAKARHFLKEHEHHPTIRRLRTAEPLTSADLTEIEQMLILAGVGTTSDLAHARELSYGLGLFLRGLVGLDRTAAKAAFQTFLNGTTPTANQIES